MKRLLILFFTISLTFLGCKENTTNPPLQETTQRTSNLQIYLVDSPASFDSLIVLIKRVEVHKSGSDSTTGWYTINNNFQRFDLLQLVNGVTAVLADTILESGQYSQVRLVLSRDNYVVEQGIRHMITIPNEFQNGININLNFSLIPDVTYGLILDFNAERSLSITEDGNYIMNPEIRIVPESRAGTISGMILPLDAQATVITTTRTDTISTTPNADGFFRLMALPSGMYNLQILPDPSKYVDTTLVLVIVSATRDTYLANIQLKSK